MSTVSLVKSTPAPAPAVDRKASLRAWAKSHPLKGASTDTGVVSWHMAAYNLVQNVSAETLGDMMHRRGVTPNPAKGIVGHGTRAGQCIPNFYTPDAPTVGGYSPTPEQVDAYLQEFLPVRDAARRAVEKAAASKAKDAAKLQEKAAAQMAALLPLSQAMIARAIGWTMADVEDAQYLLTYSGVNPTTTRARAWLAAYAAMYAA